MGDGFNYSSTPRAAERTDSIAKAPMNSADLTNILHSEQVPWAVRYALELQRLGCRTELDYLFLMGRTLWWQHAVRSPEVIARDEWAAWPHNG